MKEVVSTPADFKDNREFFNAGIKKGKILCRVWLLGKNGARDKLIGSKKVSVGKTHFSIRDKTYWIDYNELKEEKKYYTYDSDVTNAIGSLSFHDVSDKVKTSDGKVNPNQAELMLKDGQVKTFMGKGGIPALYLIVAFIVVAIALMGMMYLISQYQTNLTQIDKLKTQNANIIAENNSLKEQLAVLGAG